MASSSFFKQNERVIMVVLLVLIAPLFAFTGVFYSAISQQDGAVYYLYGEPVNRTDFQQLQKEVRDFHIYEAMRQQGALFHPGGGQQRLIRPQPYWYMDADGPGMFLATQVSPNEILDYLINTHEAKRLGLRVSDEELADHVRTAGREIIAHHKYWKQVKQQLRAGDPVNYQPGPNTPEFQEILNGTNFDESALADALNDEEFTYPIKLRKYWELLRNQLTAHKVKELVTGAVKVSEADVYERFRQQQALRELAFVRVPIERFREQAESEEPTEEQYRLTYDRHQSEFDIPNQLAIEYARIKSSELPVTDEEIEAKYEQDKDVLYVQKPTQKPDPDNPDTPDDPETKTYKPLDEVRAEVTRDVRNVKQRTIIREAHAKAEELFQEQAEGDPPFDLLAAFGDNAQYVEVEKTELFTQKEIFSLPEEIRNKPVLDSLFTPTRFDVLEVGDLGSSPVFMVTGPFIYRVAGKSEAEVRPFADVDREALKSKWVSERTYQLAEEYVAEWRQRIIDDEAVTLESFANDENYTVHTAGPIKRNESTKITVDGRPLPGAAVLATRIFQLAEPGDLTDPVPGSNRQEVLLGKYVARHDPNSADFAQFKQSLEQQELREKQMDAWQEFRRIAEEKADPRRPTVEDEEGAE